MDGSSRMCDLPDAILIHILSFLPMKDAVRTSVFSRRWEYLWTYMPEVRFDDNCQFVERALILRYHQSAIKVFSLQGFEVGETMSRINTWIGAAIRCSMEELNLSLTQLMPSYALPHCIFRCPTLMECSLTLEQEALLRLPSSIQLPNLKVLGLSHLKFANDLSFQNLLSCSRLETLCIKGCNWLNIKWGKILAPNLRELIIDDTPCDDSHFSGTSKVLIRGSNILSFTYGGKFMNDCCIYGEPSKTVDQVSINIDEGEEMNRVAYLGCKVVNNLCSTKNLSVNHHFLKALGSSDNSERLLETFAELSDMTAMAVQMEFSSSEWKALVGILRKSPRLQSLGIEILQDVDADLEEVEDVQGPVPPLCFLTKLKIYVWMEISDETKESLNHLVGFFLKNAMVLEEMILYSLGSFWKDLSLLREIWALPKSSKKCRISFPVLGIGNLVLDE